MLGLIAAERMQPYLELIRRICNQLVALCLDDDSHRNADDVLPSVLLAVYEASRTLSDLRQIVIEAAEALKDADARQRIRLSPIARQIGATALNRGDTELATVMAEAALPKPPTDSRQISSAGEAFRMASAIRPAGPIPRPGLVFPVIPTDYLDPASQTAFLELEAQVHTARGVSID